MWRIHQLQVCMILMTYWLAYVFCDSDDFNFEHSESEETYTSVRNATISIASIIGIVTGLIFLGIVVAIFVICCCCMRGRRSAGHVYRQPGNQTIITTTTPNPTQYPPPQPYNQYPPVQNQYPPQGYVQHPPPPQMGYPPVQQAPPMTGSGYPPQDNKALPTAPPADDGYPPYPENFQQPPPYPGN